MGGGDGDGLPFSGLPRPLAPPRPLHPTPGRSLASRQHSGEGAISTCLPVSSAWDLMTKQPPSSSFQLFCLFSSKAGKAFLEWPGVMVWVTVTENECPLLSGELGEGAVLGTWPPAPGKWFHWILTLPKGKGRLSLFYRRKQRSQGGIPGLCLSFCLCNRGHP